MLRRYVTAVVGRPKLVIAAVMLVTLVLGFFISRLRVLLDVDQQIPPGHPLVIVGKRIEKLFGGKYMTVVGFYPSPAPSTRRPIWARSSASPRRSRRSRASSRAACCR